MRESRLAALLAIYRKVPAGIISTPPTLVGLFASRKSPLTGPSIRRHSSTKNADETAILAKVLLEIGAESAQIAFAVSTFRV